MLNKNEIIKIINNGGATLNKAGAAITFKKGYQVSRRDCYKLNAEKVNEIAGAIRDVLSRIDSGVFCGVWIDSGVCYIDISERIKNRKKALKVAAARRQISVFDWAAGDCIYL